MGTDIPALAPPKQGASPLKIDATSLASAVADANNPCFIRVHPWPKILKLSPASGGQAFWIIIPLSSETHRKTQHFRVLWDGSGLGSKIRFKGNLMLARAMKKIIIFHFSL